MHIDSALRTILAAAMIVQAALSLSMLFAYFKYRQRIPYIKYWALASGAVSLGYGVFALAHAVPAFVPMVIGNTLFIVGMCFITEGSLKIVGKDVGVRLYTALILLSAGSFLFFGYVRPSFAIRNLILSLAVAGSSALSSFLLFRLGSPETKKTMAIGAWTYAAYAVFFSVRVFFIAAALIENGLGGTLSPTLELRFMYFSLAFFVVLGASFSTMMAGLLISDLEKSVEENKMLLNEIRHRTKNNLALVSSLVSLQESEQKDPPAKKALSDLKKRLQTITTVYRLLGKFDNGHRADVRHYLEELCAGIRDSIMSGRSSVSLDVSAESRLLDARILVPVGLIVNELTTNAIKYAFPGDRTGTIRVVFRSADADCVLEVSDDGVGFGSLPIAPPKRHEGGSLGLFLVRSLTTQLRGTLTAESRPDEGSRFNVVFRP